jgi:serine/threonine protein kinase/tetratricopeptide (TPR) repeat protein
MTTLQSGQTLSRYRLVEKIGEGGMGVVWKAEDTVLGRVVAIKVLPADVDRDEPRRQMFLQEARLASSVSEAHIVQIFDFGREQDIDFIVMEHVEGKPLSRMLLGRPLPPEEVARLGRQMAQALARAHRKGLLHRDLKPSNLLVTHDGDVKIIDFGLAILFENRDRSFLSETNGEAPTATVDGAAARAPDRPPAGLVGTLPYMSPEQGRGEALDHRSDIFSLGAVLYEMTTGCRPFTAATNADLLREIQKARPRPPHEISPKVPVDLERIIEKALAPARTDRYQTMDDLAVDLKRLTRELESGSSRSFDEISPPLRRWPWSGTWRWIMLGVLVAGLVALGAWRLRTGRDVGGDRRTILILPLNVTGVSEDAAYIGRAFAEAIAVNLAQSKDLTVLPVSEDADLGPVNGLQRAAAARKLGAGSLLTGSLIREGGLVEARLSLVDTRRNRILWGAQKHEENGSLSSLAASLSGMIATELGAVPRRRYEYPLDMSGSPRMAASPTTAEALGALRRYQSDRALDLTKKLVDEFPHEPDALALRSFALYQSPTTTRDVLHQNLVDLDNVDPGNAVGAIIRCELLTGEAGKEADLMDSVSRLLSRDDLSPALRGWAVRLRSRVRNSAGDHAAALEDIKEASLLDPTNHYNFQGLGLIRAKMGDLDGAAIAFRQCNALAPEYLYCYRCLYRVLERGAKWEEAVAAAARAYDLRRTRASCASYAYSLVRVGRQQEARKVAMEAASLPGGDSGAYDLARTWAFLGDRSEALRWLRLAVKPGSLNLSDIEDASLVLDESDFASFQSDPEFRVLLAGLRQSLRSSGSADNGP